MHTSSITAGLLASILLIGSTASAALPGSPPDASRYMLPGDPNLDPSWNWTVSGPGHTMYYSTNGAVPTPLYNIQLPFYTAGHPLNTDEKDMWPADGWMLAYRDFGTPSSAPAMPFFALYNRYRGTLRVMFYNAPQVSYNYYSIALSFKNTAATGALLTFTDPTQAFLDDYDEGKKETFMGRAQQFYGWIYADFTIAGYDPQISPTATFRLEISGIDESQISLESTQFTLSEVVDTASPSGSESSWLSDLLGAFNQGQKYYDNVEATKKALQDRLNKATADPWWKPLVVDILASPLAGLAPDLGGLLGFVTSFIGGSDIAGPREPLRFEGSLQMSGTITTSPQPIVATDLALSPGPQAPDFYRPLQTIPWGIFNLATSPVMRFVKKNWHCYGSLKYQTCGWDTDYHLKEDIAPILNPQAGLQLVSVRAAFTYSSQAPTALMDPLDLEGMLFKKSYGWPYFVGPGHVPSGVGVEIVVAPTTPTYYSDSELIIYKVYPFQQEWVDFSPMSLAITGPTSVSFSSSACKYVTWGSSLSGGYGPYSYRWLKNGVQVGAGATYTENLCPESFDYSMSLGLDVTDVDGYVTSDTHSAVIHAYDDGVPCCTGNCFAAGTMISLADGTERAIEDVTVGTEVLAYDPATAALSASPVTHTFVHPDSDGLVVVNGRLHTTANHPFLANGGWVRADELNVGDALLLLSEKATSLGSASELQSTQVRSLVMTPERTTTYNLEVAEQHTYFAGGILVHNKAVCKACD